MAAQVTRPWIRLDPLRPLDLEVDGALYVDPPHGIAKRLTRFLEHPGEHVVLWGAVGSGKSTELRVAARLLSTATLAALMALDLELDLSSEPQAWEIQASLCRALVRAAERQEVPISQPLGDRLAKAGLIERPRTQVSTQASRELTGDLMSELCSHRPVTLLVDGLEKATPARAMSITRSLVETARGTSLAVVLSPALLTGPDAYEVLQNLNLRSMALRPAVVDPRHGAQAEEGQAWLREMARRRLGPHALPESILGEAARSSGGVPRTFLQLLRDAYTSAEFADRDTPEGSDLLQARREHRASLRRLLAPGDLDCLKSALGTSGVEIPVEARVRLLAQGLLLEYEVAGASDPIVEPHPLLDL